MAKKYLLIGLVAVALCGMRANAETEPADPTTHLEGQVTMSYQDLRRLIDLAAEKSKAEESPELPGCVASALITVSFDPDHPQGSAEFAINTFSHSWVSIPFLGLDLPITAIAPEDAVIVPGNEALCLRSNRPGLTKLTVHFEVPKSFLVNPSEQISIRTGPVAYGRLQFSGVPKGKNLLVNEKLVDSDTPLILSTRGAETLIRLVPNQPESPTVWNQSTQMLVNPTAECVRVENHIQLTASSGSGLSAVADLPIDATRIEAEGVDLRPVQVEAAANNEQVILNWNTGAILNRDFTIRYQLPNPESGRPWKISPPAIAKDSTAPTLIVINPMAGTTVRSETGHDSSDLTQLPYWMQSKLSNSNFRLIHAAAPITVTTEFLPVLTVDPAHISSAIYQSTLVPDGALKCEAHITFQYRTAFGWQFRLPEGSTLLECLVKSSPADPVVKPDGELELSLPATTHSGNTESADVFLSYTARGSKFEPVEGKIHVSLPSTKLFIEQLKWQLLLPDNYEATAFEGNVEPVNSEQTEYITFKQRLLRAEVPNLDIYYHKKQLAQ